MRSTLAAPLAHRPIARLTYRLIRPLGFAALAALAACETVLVLRRHRRLRRNAWHSRNDTPTAPASAFARGPHRTDFTPYALLGHSGVDVFAAVALLAPLVTIAEHPEAALGVAVAATIVGGALWRFRPVTPAPQLGLTLAAPLALAGFAALVSALAPMTLEAPWRAAALVLIGMPFGAALVSWFERHYAAERAALRAAAWRGVTHIAADGHLTLDGERPPARGTRGQLPTNLDIRPLIQPVSRSEAREFAWSASRSRPQHRHIPAVIALGAYAVTAVVGLPQLTTFAADATDGRVQLLLSVLTVVVLAVYGFTAPVLVRTDLQTTRGGSYVRFQRFARANRLSFELGPGGDPATVVLRQTFRGTGGWYASNATHTKDRPGDSAAATTVHAGFAEFPLPARLPHLVIERRAFRLPSLLAVTRPARAQRLRLGREFDRKFTVYCPADYERDALYLLTPDVMAALLDGASAFDLEIIDDRLLLSTRRDLVTTEPGIWLTLIYAATTLTERTRQWQRWRDERLPEPRTAGDTQSAAGPAEPGARLRGTVNPAFVATMTGVLAFAGLWFMVLVAPTP